MELFQEILADMVRSGEVKINLSPLDESFKQLFKDKCYNALKEISGIIKSPELSDAECFFRIEENICVLERSGIGCGARHDFG